MEWLLSDDATVYDHLSAGHGLCWVHDWRHYAKLRPVVASHLRALEEYRTEYWELYRALLRYRSSPSEAERVRLSEAFDRLSRRETGYDALDERIQKTADKREQLLAVRSLPDIPLHNNDMELAARRRVRKRDVSFGPQSRAGARAWTRFRPSQPRLRSLAWSYSTTCATDWSAPRPRHHLPSALLSAPTSPLSPLAEASDYGENT